MYKKTIIDIYLKSLPTARTISMICGTLYGQNVAFEIYNKRPIQSYKSIKTYGLMAGYGLYGYIIGNAYPILLPIGALYYYMNDINNVYTENANILKDFFEKNQ